MEYEFNTKNRINALKANVLSIKELKEDLTLGSCLEIVLDVKAYQPAGNICVYPQSSET